MNLNAPFIIQVPPFKVVQMKMILNDDVFFGNVTVAATFTGTEEREEKFVDTNQVSSSNKRRLDEGKDVSDEVQR